MQIEPIILVGKRAKLIPLEESHIPALYETGRDPHPLAAFSAARRLEHILQTL